MKRLAFYFFTAFIFLGLGSIILAVPVGKSAPEFTATDSNGKAHKLSELKGKFVVLEWHNQDCPFVVSQYKGKMEALQKKWTKKGVIWFSVISSASGKEGSVTPAQANEDVQKHGASPTATLMDSDGNVAHAYDAKTTPHMFVINPQGVLIYNGAIDNAPLEDKVVQKNKDGETFVNYVDKALTEAMVHKATVSISSTAPYGCHVKYK